MSTDCPSCENTATRTLHPLDLSAAASSLLTIWWRLGFSALLAAQGMLLGLAVNISDVGARERLILHLLVGATSFAVVLLLGWPLLEAAGRALANRRITVELLFLTGIVGALAASIQSTITGQGPIYFEVISVLLVVYTFSKTMIAKRRNSALAASQGWFRNLEKARLRDEAGRTSSVPATAIQLGDLVEVQPGEWIPIDGVIEQGTAFIRDTPMTGEPFARVVRPGDALLAGFAVEDATLLVRATAAGAERSIDELRLTVEEARGTTGAMQRHADRLTSLFLPFVLTVAGSTFAIWVTIAEWPTALMNSMSVLLIACPCALGLATPLAVWSTLSSLASQGLVVRQANLIDALARVDHVVFDKTGTLTDDRLYLVDVVTRSAGAERSRLLSWIAEVESRSSHPVARALATITTDPHTVAVSNVEVVIEPGCGIFARFEDERGASHEMRIGRSDWIGVPSDSQETAVSPSARFASLHRDNGGRIDVELDGRLEAICILREKVRPSVTETVGRLKGKGIRVSILTGDRSENRTAEIVENVIGALRPHEKADVIDNWQRAGASCLYVGDGINDAPAMCKADAAIALGSGAELAKSAAPAVLNHGNLETVVFAVEACRRAVRTVNSNLLWAASYNAVGMAVAASGYLHPVAAALLMVGSSLLVSSRSLRLCT